MYAQHRYGDRARVANESGGACPDPQPLLSATSRSSGLNLKNYTSVGSLDMQGAFLGSSGERVQPRGYSRSQWIF